MRRPVARHAFTALSALSLLLCVAVCVLWVRSYSHVTSLVLHRDPDGAGERLWELNSLLGGFYLSTMRFPAGPYPQATTKRVLDVALPEIALHAQSPRFAFAGFQYQSEKPWGFTPGRPRHWRIPFWFLAALTGVLPVWRATVTRRARRRARRVERGLCPTCGYDLRASPGRCPECGAAAAAAADGPRAGDEAGVAASVILPDVQDDLPGVTSPHGAETEDELTPEINVEPHVIDPKLPKVGATATGHQ
jgi:hypothetical protein